MGAGNPPPSFPACPATAAEKDARQPLKRFLPYYRHLWKVKGIFAAGVIAGVVYAAASGLGLPLMTKVVFPVLFESEAAE